METASILTQPHGLIAQKRDAPTFYELAGVPIPPEVVGRSLVPLLDSARAQATPWRDDEG